MSDLNRCRECAYARVQAYHVYCESKGKHILLSSNTWDCYDYEEDTDD